MGEVRDYQRRRGHPYEFDFAFADERIQGYNEIPFIYVGGWPVKLTPGQHACVWTLGMNIDKIMSRLEIAEFAWGGRVTGKMITRFYSSSTAPDGAFIIMRLEAGN